MPPIELGHGLECVKKKISTFPQFGNEDHLVKSKRKDNQSLGIQPLHKASLVVVALRVVIEAPRCRKFQLLSKLSALKLQLTTGNHKTHDAKSSLPKSLTPIELKAHKLILFQTFLTNWFCCKLDSQTAFAPKLPHKLVSLQTFFTNCFCSRPSSQIGFV